MPQEQVQAVDNSTEQQQPINEPVVTQPNQQTDDIVARASQFKIPEKQPVQSSQGTDEVHFDYGKLQSLKTPEEVKQWAEDAYKSMQRGYNTKYQDLATLKKTYEAKLSEVNANSNWTPQRVQQLLNDKNFVEAAQSIVGSEQQPEEDSYLSESDKKRIQEADARARQALEFQSQFVREKEHESLKARYANYEPSVVDELRNSLLQGKINATSEHLWKVVDYDSAVKRAYELGKSDAITGTTEKVSASSFDGLNITNNAEQPKPEEGESDQSFFRRLVARNTQRAKEVQQTRK